MIQQPAVNRAGEDHRQPPGLPPGPAVVLLDGAAVSGQALGAVPGRGGEHPWAGDRACAPLVTGDRGSSPWIPAGHADHAQSGDLSGAEPGGVRERQGRRGVQDHHVASRSRQMPAGVAGGQPGELKDLTGSQVETAGEPEQVAGQGLLRQRVQAAGQRAHVPQVPGSRRGRGHRHGVPAALAAAARAACGVPRAELGWERPG